MQVSIESVIENIFKHYHQNLEYKGDMKLAYTKVLYELKTMTPKLHAKFMKLNIQLVNDLFNENDQFYDVSGTVDAEEIKYGIEFMSWEEWLGLQIIEDQLELLTKEEYVAHALWEMTYMGFDQSIIQSDFKELNKSCDKCRKDIKSGNMSNYKTWEEVKKSLLDENDDF